MVTLFGEQVRCPVCGHTFQRQRVASTEWAGTDEELRPRYAGKGPEPFLITVCPACGYARDAEAFLEPVADDVAAWVQETFSGGSIPPWEGYARWAALGERLGEGPLAAAERYLSGAWCADDAGATEAARELRRRAYERFLAAWETGPLPRDQRPVVAYLLGVLAGKLEGPDARRRWWEIARWEVGSRRKRYEWLLERMATGEGQKGRR